MTDKTRSDANHQADAQSSPQEYMLLAKGPLTKAFIQEKREIFTPTLGKTVQGQDLNKIITELSSWNDTQCATLLEHYYSKSQALTSPPIDHLLLWMRNHPNDAQAVNACMDVSPPDGVEIVSAMPRRGAQKIVFRAVWKVSRQDVVLKAILDQDIAENIISRELLAHPFSLKHANIIETHRLTNQKNEVFLIEELLPEVLDDSWSANGIQEAANLLYDILLALQHLHEGDLIHGDIKPDNIGLRNGRYILLDFGICRPSTEFTPEATATGSLRTRAPELFGNETYTHPKASDIWAIGATIFNTLLGRYPFCSIKEFPTPGDIEARNLLESKIKERIDNEWDNYLSLQEISEPLRRVLQHIFIRDPASRWSALQLIKLCEDQLSGLLRNSGQAIGLTPQSEIEQISKYLPLENIDTMPYRKKRGLIDRLEGLKTRDEIDNTSKEMALKILETLTTSPQK